MNSGFGDVVANQLANLYGQTDLSKLGLDIMGGHHEALKLDHDGVRGRLSEEQVDTYHNEIFQNYQGAVYGGNLPSGWYYCGDCEGYSSVDWFIKNAH